jgi:NADPH:quinone reductase-like Zn-dependent oxidoreductase
MRNVEITAFGLEHVVVTERAQPEPGPHEVVIRVHAASLNYRDLMIAQGLYKPDLSLPLIPLSDGAGEVIAVGEHVSRVRIGDRVSSVFWQRWPDGSATAEKVGASTGCEAPGLATECAVLAEDAVIKIPDSMSFADAATLPCAGLTAWTALTTVAGVKAGDTVLLLGTGGVSIFALQIAKALGAQVIITSSSDAKLERARELGADHGINYTVNETWGEEAFRIAGQGARCVVETGGAGTLTQSIEALAWDGHIAYLGVLAGMSGELSLMGLLFRAGHIDCIMVGSRAEHEKMIAFIDTHHISPVIDRRYELGETARALGALAGGQHFGKIVIDCA